MPTFTGNLRTIGIEARNGSFPEITCTATNAGVNISGPGNIFAGSRTFTPETNGDITLILAATVNLVPEAKVKLTGGWLGDDGFFELPPFHVPETSGTLADLIAFAGFSSQQYISWGTGAPDPNWPGGVYFDLSTNPPKLHLRGSI